MRRRWLLLLSFIFAGYCLFAENNIEVTGILKNNRIFDKIVFDLEYQHKNIELFTKLSMNNDDKYYFSQKDYSGGHYYDIENGGIKVKYENILFSYGKLLQEDEVKTPFSLFFSSKQKNAYSIITQFEDDNILYKAKWIELNRMSAYGYPDRGMIYKTLVLKFNDIRFGYQDVIIHPNRSFEAAYLLSPIPAYILQETLNSSERPDKRASNENSIMGFFIDNNSDKNYMYGQILVDDFNGNRLFKPNEFQNPDKIAISMGYVIKLPKEKIGLHLAAATKYAFEPYGGGTINDPTNTKYGYTYYPDTEYGNNIIDNVDNYIGYKNGENNIAIASEYYKKINEDELNFYGELRLTGAQSPANPWHEFADYSEDGEGTKFLDEKCEISVSSKCSYQKRINHRVSVKIGIDVDYITNKLKPIYLKNNPSGNNITIFKPSEEIESRMEIVVGFKYNI